MPETASRKCRFIGSFKSRADPDRTELLKGLQGLQIAAAKRLVTEKKLLRRREGTNGQRHRRRRAILKQSEKEMVLC